MVKIKEFRGLRYNAEKEDMAKLVTPPYDVISPQQAEMFRKKSSHNFVNIILNKNHREAGQLIVNWERDGILKKEERDCIYIYSQKFTAEGKSYTRTGFVALIELEELGKNILPHEKTLPKPLLDRIDLMEHTKCNEGQVFFIYEDSEKEIDNSIDKYKSEHEPIFQFTDDAFVIHTMWGIDNRETIEKIKSSIKNRKVVIADGHHRYKAALEFSVLHPELTGAKYRLATFVNSFNEGLIILPTNRLLFNFEITEKILGELKTYFAVTELANIENVINELNLNKAEKNYVIGFIDNAAQKYYVLKLRDRSIMKKLIPDSTETYRMLDVKILHRLIFEKIMGISEDEQGAETKIEFVKGNDETIKKLAEKKYAAAFLLNPPQTREVFETAGSKEVMPQKSTYFYPKVFSGLVLYKLTD